VPSIGFGVSTVENPSLNTVLLYSLSWCDPRFEIQNLGTIEFTRAKCFYSRPRSCVEIVYSCVFEDVYFYMKEKCIDRGEYGRNVTIQCYFYLKKPSSVIYRNFHCNI
jgi:hypothetical protein